MKNHTQAEVKAFVEKLWGFEPDRVSVRKDRASITMSAMYSAPGLTFRQLMALAEFFETDNIKDTDHSYSAGCETCDWGSKSEYTLEIEPGEWPIRSQG